MRTGQDHTLKTEILYIPDCPNLAPARQQVERLLAEHAVGSSVQEVRVEDREAAARLGFPGSPTIRIDGEDVVTSAFAVSTAFACRTYETAGRLSGIPSDDIVREAIRRAIDRRTES